MIREEVIVVAAEGDRVVVVGQRQGSCGSCHQEGACTTLSLGAGKKEIRLEAQNLAGAEVGDRVLLEISERYFLRASFLVYVVPVIALFVGGILFRALALAFGIPLATAEGVGGAMGLALMLAFFFGLKRFEGRLRGEEMPVVRTILAGPAGRAMENRVVPLQFHPRRDDQR
ncbi:MAG: SoxR reducing system RseC family protein [Magnetococcales bacterium]|nr:SoxR reducing system RseC family protein [Magnetococcales bacterium]